LIYLITPSAVGLGDPVPVSVTGAWGQTAGKNDTAANPPTITGVSPDFGKAGTAVGLVTNTGSGFTSASTVQLTPPSGTPLSPKPTFVNSATLTVSLPALTAGTWQITVTNPASGAGTSSISPLFITTTGSPVSNPTVSTNNTASIKNAVSATGSGGTGTIALATYQNSPTGGSNGLFSLNNSSTFINLYVAPGSTYTSVTFNICDSNKNDQINYFNGTTWVPVSPVTYTKPLNPPCPGGSGGFVFKASGGNMPNLAQLGGTPFAIGSYGLLCVMNGSADNALSLTGGSSLTVDGGAVAVNSSASDAAAVTGSGSVTDENTPIPLISVVGGCSSSGGGSFSPAANCNQKGTVTDPLAGLALPAAGTASAVSVSGNNQQTLGQGTYSSIQVSGNGKLALSGGTYVFTGSGLSVSGNGSVTGQGGVTLFFGRSGACKTGQQGAALSVTGNGTMNLSAPSSGTYDGIVIFYDPNNAAALSLTGNAGDSLSGAIYAPAAGATISGKAALALEQMVVGTLTMRGGSTITIGAGAGSAEQPLAVAATAPDDNSAALLSNGVATEQSQTAAASTVEDVITADPHSPVEASGNNRRLAERPVGQDP